MNKEELSFSERASSLPEYEVLLRIPLKESELPLKRFLFSFYIEEEEPSSDTEGQFSPRIDGRASFLIGTPLLPLVREVPQRHSPTSSGRIKSFLLPRAPPPIKLWGLPAGEFLPRYSHPSTSMNSPPRGIQ